MKSIRRIIRDLLFPIATWLKIEKLFSNFSKNNNLILCFHGVATVKNNLNNNRHMPADQFEKLIAYLKKEFTIVPVQELFSIPATDKKRIAITFDDGYLNNFTVALPILEKHGIPATFYITTESFEIEEYCLWPEIFDILKVEQRKEPIVFNNETFFLRENRWINEHSGSDIYEYVKNLGSERQLFFREFISRYQIKEKLKGQNPELVRFCSPEQIRQMSQSRGIEIGSHTHRHYNLSRIDPALAEEELKKSKHILESVIQKPVLSIAYPDGDYSKGVKDLAEKAGYVYQLAVRFSEKNDPSDRRIKSRYSISNSTSLDTNKIIINLQFRKAGF